MKIHTALAVLATTLLAGCVDEVKLGDGKTYPCVGAFEKQNPKLEYNLSKRNLIVGVIFFEIAIPPVVVLVDQTFCPVGVKEATP